MRRRDFVKLVALIALTAGSTGMAWRLLEKGSKGETPVAEDRGLEEVVGVEVVAENLKVPWSVVPLGESRYIVSERPGNVLAVTSEGHRLVASFNVAAVGEAGLLGLALHPEYPHRPYLYAYMSYYGGPSGITNRVVRIRLNLQTLKAEGWSTIFDGIPGARIHDGGRIRFGPDGMLYITTGDAARPELSQRLDSTVGKILRVDENGAPPRDNPFSGSPVYSYGHRNPQGIDWSPTSRIMVASEHGPRGHDEINVIHPGGNYGWPIVKGRAGREEYIDPVLESGPDVTWAPSGASFVRGDMFPELQGSFMVACLRGQRLLRINIENAETARLAEEAFEGAFGRLRDVVVDEDGSLLLLTSNTDGRGRPREGDDRLIRLYKN